MLQCNILQYLTKILRQFFNCNERLEIFLKCFCNILCYVECVSCFTETATEATSLTLHTVSHILNPTRKKCILEKLPNSSETVDMRKFR